MGRRRARRTRRSRTSTRCRALHGFFAPPWRAADLRRHVSGRARSGSADVLRALRGGTLRDWRAPSRVGDAAVQRRRTSSAISTRSSLPLSAIRRAARVADRRPSSDAVGARPVSYRSGRFGFSAAHVSSLERQGYLVDSSVAPLFYEAHKGGPDFVGAPLTPYFLAYDHATRPGIERRAGAAHLAALHRRVPRALAAVYGRAPRAIQTKRMLRLLRVARSRVAAAVLLVARRHDRAGRARRRGVPILNLIFHSSEAIVGGSPYNRTQGELDAFFDRLERFLAFARTELGAEPRTFREFRDAHVGHDAPA